MTEADVVEISYKMIMLIIKCSAPLLLVSLIVGLIISIFQTVTSIQEQTLTFVPKLIAIFVTLLLAGGWIMNNCKDFLIELCQSFSAYVN
ncbi:MAG: flagellar biosynthesis protein FliQ [Eubacterium sp.]|nr:flagellar biosynthesis protein FliQ [Eubacterium sp.]